MTPARRMSIGRVLLLQRSLWIVWILAAFAPGSPAQGLQADPPPDWAVQLISGGSPGKAVAITTDVHPDAETARAELQQKILVRVTTFLGERLTGLDPAVADWNFVHSLIGAEKTWIGEIPQSDGSQTDGESGTGPEEPLPPRFQGLALLRLDTAMVQRARQELRFRKQLKRVESLLLGLVAAVGSVAIAWLCLVLDHKTRHHFSRRFQTLAIAVWILFGLSVAFAWWRFLW